MCGIVGGWWKEKKHAIERMPLSLAQIQHRGPDHSEYKLYDTGVGSVAFGHARLSIIDLSDAGRQPMHTSDDRYAIIFNGEIYNYRELRNELKQIGHKFFTDSDTEVLLAAWSEWGLKCLPRLVGMFAIAVLDKKNSTVTCIRDAFGIKPLFYSAGKEHLVFASEMPALLKLLPASPELNWQRAYDYLVHGDYDSTPETFYGGVQHLPPGHWMQLDTATGHLTEPVCWWKPEVQERSGWNFEAAVEQVREQFLKNVRFHLRSDVPIGAALSGGIDSSAIVCAMRHVEPNMPIHTFSFIAQGADVSEEKWIDRVNTHVGAIAHKVHVMPQELARDLEDMIRTQGEPFGSTSIYAQYRVYQLAKQQGITVTLDGQGADEMLAGYIGYPGQRLRSLLETGKISAAWTYWNTWSKGEGRSKLLAAKYLASEMTNGVLYETLRKLDGKPSVPRWINAGPLMENGVRLTKPKYHPDTLNRGRRVMDELGLSLTKRGIPTLLRHGDRNSMRFSIESRVPFLTTDLANLLLSMPEEYLISNEGQTKNVFRAAMRGIVPDDILDRRDKIGFATPEYEWLLSLGSEIKRWIAEAPEIKFINKAEVVREFEDIVAGRSKFDYRIWRIINFMRWYTGISNGGAYE